MNSAIHQLKRRSGRVVTNQTKVVHFGLGPIGIAVARVVFSRTALVPIGAVDIRKEIVGHDLGSILDIKPAGVTVVESLIDIDGGQGCVVAHCTGSSLISVMPQLVECVEAGHSVVSTCEELSFPWKRNRIHAEKLDALAREHGVVVLGTGVNPGFAMDFIPIVLASAGRSVERISVSRRQDAGVRRKPLQAKVGVGLTVDEFGSLVEQGVVRHVGLLESADAICAAFGWETAEVEERFEPVVADRAMDTELGTVEIGNVVAIRQEASARFGDKEVVRLRLEMAVGIDNPADEISIEGDPAITTIIPGGLHGDVATAAMVANCIPAIDVLAPGLRTMAEVSPSALAKGLGQPSRTEGTQRQPL